MNTLTFAYTDSCCAACVVQVGVGTLGCSLRFAATLLAFFFSSTVLTQFREEQKAGLDDSMREGGQRDWKQVWTGGAYLTVLQASRMEK